MIPDYTFIAGYLRGKGHAVELGAFDNQIEFEFDIDYQTLDETQPDNQNLSDEEMDIQCLIADKIIQLNITSFTSIKYLGEYSYSVLGCIEPMDDKELYTFVENNTSTTICEYIKILQKQCKESSPWNDVRKLEPTVGHKVIVECYDEANPSDSWKSIFWYCGDKKWSKTASLKPINFGGHISAIHWKEL